MFPAPHSLHYIITTLFNRLFNILSIFVSFYIFSWTILDRFIFKLFSDCSILIYLVTSFWLLMLVTVLSVNFIHVYKSKDSAVWIEVRFFSSVYNLCHPAILKFSLIFSSTNFEISLEILKFSLLSSNFEISLD